MITCTIEVWLTSYKVSESLPFLFNEKRAFGTQVTVAGRNPSPPGMYKTFPFGIPPPA